MAKKRKPPPAAFTPEKPYVKPSKSSLDGLRKIRDIVSNEIGSKATLSLRIPEAGKGRTPWAVEATIGGFDLSYADMARLLRRIEDNATVTRLIGERTYSRIVGTYKGAKHYGQRGRTKRPWTMGEIAPWGNTSARAANAVYYARETYGSGDRDNPAGASRMVEIKVWISTDTAKDMIDEQGAA